MEKYTVDSVSDGQVTLLLRSDEIVRVVVPVEQLPGVRESDIISAEIAADKVIRFSVESGETADVKAKIQARLDKLKNRPGR
jgi:hypothetical protein